VNVKGEPSGLIKLVLPYDGEKYFTQQAYKEGYSGRPVEVQANYR
jgi:hypothetical protein